MAAIFSAVNWLVVVFACPETQYSRDAADALASSPSSASDLASDEESNPTGMLEKTVSATEKQVVTSPPGTSRAATQVPLKPWAQQLRPWSGVAKNTNLLELFVRPFPLIAYPAVIFAFLGYAVALAWVVAINILNSFVLQAPPYNWKPSINGLINIPGLLGNLFGAWAGGWLVDRYSDWRSRKNGGVFQPESRLMLLIIPGLLVPAGCLVFGYGVQDTLHWISLFFGYGMISVGLTAVSARALSLLNLLSPPIPSDSQLTSDEPGTLHYHDLRFGLLSPCGSGCVAARQRLEEHRRFRIPAGCCPMGDGDRLRRLFWNTGGFIRGYHRAWCHSLDLLRTTIAPHYRSVAHHTLGARKWPAMCRLRAPNWRLVCRPSR